jgi:hypothetical protein
MLYTLLPSFDSMRVEDLEVYPFGTAHQHRSARSVAEDVPCTIDERDEEHLQFEHTDCTDEASASIEASALEIPQWALTESNRHIAEAFNNVADLPDLDYVLYINWLTISSIYTELFECGFSGEQQQSQAPSPQELSDTAAKYGKLAFVWSVETYATKSKIVAASEHIVLLCFAESDFYTRRANKLALVEKAAAIGTEPLPDSIRAKYDSPYTGLVITTADNTTKKIPVPEKDVDVYQAFWTVHHPAHAYKNRIEPFHKKAANPQELIHMWASVFTTEEAEQHATAYRNALLTLLLAAQPPQ